MFLGRAVSFGMVLVFLISPLLLAEEAINEKITQLEAHIKALEQKFDTELHRQVGVLALTEAGFTIGAGATMIVQGTNNTNATEKKKENKTDASYSADITIGKKFEEINSEVFLHLETGQGLGLENELTLYSNVNRDANNDTYIKISELWYEQKLFENKALIIFGKLDPTIYFDNTEIANDETTQFLARIFRNNPAVEFPDNTAGVRLALALLEWLELSYGMFDADSNWEKIGDNLFNIGQLNFRPNFFERDGNYRFFGWYNNSYHTKWLNTEKQKEGAYGFGLSFDQKISDTTTLFTRYGWQNPKVYNPSITTTGGGLNYSLEHSWSAGFQIEGKPWRRENDILAFALGEAIPSDDYKKADSSRRAENEGHFETYYSLYINDHLSISPDFQYIWNPFGKDVTDDTESIFVYGIRTQVDF